MTQQDLTACPQNLTGLLDYQDSAIVSKTLLKHTSGSVTLFAFDEGEELSDHTVAFNALAHILEGEAEISIEGEPHTVRAGEMIIFPADQPHALKATAQFKMLLVMIWGTKR